MPSVAFTMLTLIVLTSGALAEPPNFRDQIKPIFAAHCLSCHNADDLRGGLNLAEYRDAMIGGGGGAVALPGDPAGSPLLGVIRHTREPKMPPRAGRIPDDAIAVIEAWIAGGCLEAPGGAPAPTRPVNPALQPAADAAVTRADLFGVGLPLAPVQSDAADTAPLALAVHPASPLVAIGGQRQILVYHTRSLDLVGVLPLPGESWPFSLRFTRDGAWLVAGAGVSGLRGSAVIYDAATGIQLAALGDEVDAVRAADVDRLHASVALGGPARKVKWHSLDGALLRRIDKHTEWITDLAFSPDQILLASADRNGGTFLWESENGAPFAALEGHPAAVHALDWRADGNLLATACEDGQVRLWSSDGGALAKAWQAHDGGVLCARFLRDGRLLTAGRDRTAKLWDGSANLVRTFGPFPDLALSAAADPAGTRAFVAVLAGPVRVLSLDEGRELALLPTVAPSLAGQLSAAEHARAEKQAARDAAGQSLAAAQQAQVAATAPLDAARAQHFSAVHAWALLLATGADATAAAASRETAFAEQDRLAQAAAPALAALQTAQAAESAAVAELAVADARRAKWEAAMLRVECDKLRQAVAESARLAAVATAHSQSAAQACADLTAHLEQARAAQRTTPAQLAGHEQTLAAAQAALEAAASQSAQRSQAADAAAQRVVELGALVERLRGNSSGATPDSLVAQALAKTDEALALLRQDADAHAAARDSSRTAEQQALAAVGAARTAAETLRTQQQEAPALVSRFTDELAKATEAATIAAAAADAARRQHEASRAALAAQDELYRARLAAAAQAYARE